MNSYNSYTDALKRHEFYKKNNPNLNNLIHKIWFDNSKIKGGETVLIDRINYQPLEDLDQGVVILPDNWNNDTYPNFIVFIPTPINPNVSGGHLFPQHYHIIDLLQVDTVENVEIIIE